MEYRRRALSSSITLVLCQSCAVFALAPRAAAQTVVGPGTQTTTLTATSGETLVVGNTTINTSAGSTDGVYANGGNITLDMAAGASPGSIVVRSGTGRGLHATSGTISAPNGLNLFAGNAAAMFADGGAISLLGGNVSSNGARSRLAGATAGTVTIGATSYNDPALVTGAGSGVGAEGTGRVELGSGNRFFVGGAGVNNPVGLGVQGPGASIAVTSRLPITFQSSGAMGIYLYGGGQLQPSAPIALTFTGASSVGLTLDGTTNAQTISGLTATFNSTATMNSTGTGVVAMNNSSATLNDLTVDGPAVGLGVWVRTGSALTLSGASNVAVSATRNGQAYSFTPGPTSSMATTTIFGSVSAPSQRAAGLVQSGTLTSSGTTWSNPTVQGYGIYAGQNGPALSTVSLTGDTVTTSGASGTTLQTYSNGQIRATDSTIRNDGGLVALYVWSFGSPTQQVAVDSRIDLVNTPVTATGPAYGLYSNNMSKGWDNVVTLQGGHLTSDQWAIVADGPLEFSATNTEVSGVEGLLSAGEMPSASGAATLVNLFADHSILKGVAEADSASQANIVLSNQSHWTGQSWNVTNVSIDPSSIWTIPEISTVSQLVSNSGRIEFTAPVDDVYKHLYTQSYVGGAGSVLAMNTYLGEDDSPTDQLILDGGSATGQSALEIHNSGGPGALTTGDGIRLVVALNGARTDATAFTNNQLLLAGPYNYRLYRGGVAANGEDWFLRSAVDCSRPDAPVPPCPSPPPPPPPPPPVPPPPPPPPPPEPPPPVPPPPPPPPAPGPDPEPPPVPPPPQPPTTDPTPPDPPEPAPPPAPTPDYRAEVSLYTALPAMALRYGWATLGNLHERVGEQEQLRGRADLREDDYFNGAWVRVIGENGDVEGSRRGIYDGSPKYDYDILAIQAGADAYAVERDDGKRDHAGFYLGQGRIRTDVTHYDGTLAGRNEVRATSLGLYWTRYWEEGQYLDAVWQGSWGKGKSRSSNGLLLERDSFGWAASLEGGYPFWDDDHTRIFEPQLQVIYQRIPTDHSQDPAATVRFRDMDSLAARLGLRWANTWTLEPTDAGIRRLFTGWLRLNAWHEFQGQPVTEFSSADGYVPFEADLKGTWWQINAGMTWQLGASTSLYANLGYQKSFDRDFDAWDGKLGVRWNW